MSDESIKGTSQKIRDALEFLSPEEIKGCLEGTLLLLELMNPGYTDTLVLKIISARSGVDTE